MAWRLRGWAVLRPWVRPVCLCEISEHKGRKALEVCFQNPVRGLARCWVPGITAPLPRKLPSLPRQDWDLPRALLQPRVASA